MVRARSLVSVSICAALFIVSSPRSFASERGPQTGTVAAHLTTMATRTGTARSSESQLRVNWEFGKISLDVEGAPLSKVLQAVSRETGIEVVGGEGLNDRVFAHFVGMDLFDALRKLLAHVDYAISASPTGSASRQGTRVIILKRSAGSGPMNLVKMAETSASVRRVRTQEQHRTAIHVTRTGEPPNAVEPALQLSDQSSEADQPPVTAALDAAQDPSTFAGGNAAQALAVNGDPEATDISTEALPSTDPSPDVAASGKLAEVAAATAGGDLTALREYLQDADAAVQAAAFDALAAQDRDAAVEELLAIIRDTSRLVRLQALQLLTQLPQIDEQTVMTVLRDAVNDPALSAYASQALAQRDNADMMDTATESP